MIRVGERGAVLSASPAETDRAQADFQIRHHLRLPGFLDPALLHKLHSKIRASTFEEKVHGDIGRELVSWDSPAAATLLFLLNDPRLFDLVRQLTGAGPIGCFLGRIYRMTGSGAHHDKWHSDAVKDRLLALSVNLSEEPYRGGALVLREQGRPDTEQVLENTGPGDAILFRIDPALEHNITDVLPGPPKTAWAGWFCARPSFRDVLTGRAAKKATDC